jgi:catechol 2,3-dioxygenase-like lactoylglutathione lyase family enzyme
MGYLESPVFHVTQIIDSLDSAFDCHRRLFCRPVSYAGYWDVVERDAIMTFVGGVIVEGMVPHRRKDGSRSFAGQDLDPFLKAPGGGHLHSLAWYAVGIDDLAGNLRKAGVRFVETSGELISGTVPTHGPIPSVPGSPIKYPPGWKSAVLYSYFEDGPGMIELCEPSSHHPGMKKRRSGKPAPSRLDPDNPVQGQREVDPLGIERVSHQTVAVPDAAAAARFFEDVFGGQRVYEGESETAVARTIIVRVGDGDGTFMELAEPAGPGPVQSDLDRFGHAILHACTFKVSDLGAVREQLASEEFALESETPATVVVDPAGSAGSRFGFTTTVVADLKL